MILETIAEILIERYCAEVKGTINDDISRCFEIGNVSYCLSIYPNKSMELDIYAWTMKSSVLNYHYTIDLAQDRVEDKIFAIIEDHAARY